MLADGIMNDMIGNLNQFPRLNRVTSILFPLTFVTGELKIDFNMLKTLCSNYTEVYENNQF